MPELTTASAVSFYISGAYALTSVVTPFLAAAEDYIAQYCNRRDLGGNHWLSATHTEYVDGEIASDVMLKFTPVTAIASVDNTTGATTSYTYTLTDLEIDGIAIASLSTTVSAEVGRLGLRNTFLTGVAWELNTYAGQPWGRYTSPNFGAGRKRVKVVYTGGYQAGSVPAALTQAAKQLAAAYYNESQTDPNLKSETLGEYSYTNKSASEIGSGASITSVQALLEPYRCYSNMV